MSSFDLASAPIIKDGPSWNTWINQLYEKLRGPNWNTVIWPVYNASPGPSTPATQSVFGPSNVGLGYEFNRGDNAYGTLLLPNNIKPNSTAYLDVHWTTDGTGGDVEWTLTFSTASDNEVLSTPTTLTIVGTSGTAWTSHHDEASTAITVTYPETVYTGSITRGSTSDTYDNTGNGGVWALAVSLHYQSDRLGTANRSSDYYKRGT